VTLLKTTQILLQFHYLLMFSASIYKFVNLSCQFDIKGNSSCIHQSNNHHDQHMLKWGWMEFWLCHKKEGFNKVRNGALRVRNGALRVRNDALRVRNDALRVRNGALRIRNGALRVRNGALRVRDNFCMLKLLLFFHIIFYSYQYHL
jgi:hypothetical protein